MEIAFGILGQTTVRMHGNLVMNRTQRRELKILAAMLTQPGKRISIPTLVDWAWNDDEDPPKNKKDALYKNIARIRQVLATTGTRAAVVLTNGGYLIEIDENLIDLTIFRQKMTSARRLADLGHHHSACESARAALALWRDEPLAGMTSGLAENWRRSITETDWFPAATFLITELLAAAQPDAALRQLDTVGHPTDLRFALLRMRTLQALGRFGAEDDYYMEIRRYFREEGDQYALDELFALHEDLRRQRARTTPRENPAQPLEEKLAPLHALPRDIPGFTGREDVLAQLDSAITPGDTAFRPVVVTLTGPPGVGKTSTAVRWAHRAAERFPGGVMLLDMQGLGPAKRREHAEAIEIVLSTLNFLVDRIVSPLGRAAKLRALLRDRPMLIILDNIEDTGHAAPLIDVFADCAVIITAWKWLPSFNPLTVPPLSATESMALLSQRLGRRTALEHEAVTDLVSLCSGLPLALTLVADRAAVRPGVRLGTMAAQFRDDTTLLTIGDEGDATTKTLLSVFSWSYRGLDEAAQSTFRLFGVHPSPEITGEALIAASTLPASAVRRALDMLVSAHLIQQPADADRYRVYDLFHKFAATLTTLDPDSDIPRRRLVSYYVHTAAEAHRTYYPHAQRPDLPEREPGCIPTRFTDPISAMRWSLGERGALAGFVRDIATTLPAHAIVLTHLIVDFLDRHGFYDDILSCLAIAMKCSAELGDTMSEAATLNDIGQIHLLTGDDRLAEDYFHRAVRLLDDLGHPIGAITVTLNLARVHRHAGRLAEAKTLYEGCLVECQRAGDRERESAAAHNLASTLVELDQHHRALHYYHHALHLRKVFDDVDRQLATHTALTTLHTELAEYPQARAHCEHGLRLLARVHDLPATMKLHTVRAQLAYAEGRAEEALDLVSNAFALSRRIGIATGEARVLEAQGNILFGTGDPEGALDAWHRAEGLYRGRARNRRADAVLVRIHELEAALPAIPTSRSASGHIPLESQQSQ